MTMDAFLGRVEHDRIVGAIKLAEGKTSGEIRVFVSHGRVRDALGAARKQFVRMDMHRTRLRNGVLIFVAPRSRGVAVVGDWGVHAQCGEGFWNEVVEGMKKRMRAGEFMEGIVEGVERVGEVLGRYFPRVEGDANELGDEVEEG